MLIVGASFGVVASGAVSHSVAPTANPAASLRITYSTSVFHLTYRLHCSPPSGTLQRPGAVCAAIARTPAMVLPPAEPSVHPCSPPAPDWEIQVTGTYRGQSVHAGFFSPSCGADSYKFGSRWLAYLPSSRQLDSVRVDRGLGPLRLGQPSALVRELLGPPARRKGGFLVYHDSDIEIEGAPVIFAVGYGRSGRVTSLIYNGPLVAFGEQLARAPGKRSPLRRWRTLLCGGHHSLANHRPVIGRPTTIVRYSAESPTAIVTTTPSAACAGAVATGL